MFGKSGDSNKKKKPMEKPMRKSTAKQDPSELAELMAAAEVEQMAKDAMEIEDNRPIEMLEGGMDTEEEFMYQTATGPSVISTAQKGIKPGKDKSRKPAKATKTAATTAPARKTPVKHNDTEEDIPWSAKPVKEPPRRISLKLPAAALVAIAILMVSTFGALRQVNKITPAGNETQLLTQIDEQQKRITDLESQLAAGTTTEEDADADEGIGATNWDNKLAGVVTATPEYAESLQSIHWHGLELYTPRDTTMIRMNIQNDRILLSGDKLEMRFDLHLLEADMQSDLTKLINGFMSKNEISDFEILTAKSEDRREFIYGGYTRDGTKYEQYFAILQIKDDIHMFVQYEYATESDTVSQKTLESAIIANVIPRFN